MPEIEYAKSNRSTCKGCHIKLGMGEMRIGDYAKSVKFDGSMVQWYHVDCFLLKKYVPDFRCIKNMWQLRWDDQMECKRKVIAQHATFLTKQAAKIPKEILLAKRKEMDSILDDKPAKRQKLDNQPQYATQTVVTLRDELSKRSLSTKGRKHELIALLEEDDQDKKITTSEEPSTPSIEPNINDTSLFKLNEIKNEQEVREDTNALWNIQDDLATSCSTKEIVLILKKNNIPIEGTQEQQLLSCAQAVLFGVPAPCNECDSGTFRWRGNMYVCKNGHISAWAKCENTAKLEEVKRKPLTIPPALTEQKFFKNRNLTPKKHVIREVFLYDSPHRVCTFNQQIKKLIIESKKDKLLFGCVFSLLKCSKPKKEITALIERAGGYCLSTLNPAKITHVLCSRHVAYQNNGKYRNIKALELPIYDDSWLFDALEANQIPTVLTDYLLEGKPDPLCRTRTTLTSHKKEEKSEELVSLQLSGNGIVDAKAGKNKGNIYEKNGIIYSATLSRADITLNINTFYIMQIIQEGEDITFFRRWGRVGTKIGSQSSKDLPPRDAITAFTTSFYEKTGNSWETMQKGNFVKKPDKFFPVDTNSSSDLIEIQKNIQNNQSELPPSLQVLMRLIFDIESMQATLLDMKIDPKKMPLGFLSASLVKKGFQILTKIQEVLESGEGRGEEAGKQNASSTLTGLTNQFYTLIPQSFGGKRPPLINNIEMVKEKTTLLQMLQEMEIATSLLKASEKPNPIDDCYHQLHCTIESMEKKSEEYEMVEGYLMATQEHTSPFSIHLKELFSIDREGEQKRFEGYKDSLHNRQLLWHGSRLMNWAGILSQGLRIAPPEAPVTGYLFGKGIYFSEAVSKAATYCFASQEKKEGLLLLSEVALGNMQEYNRPTCVTSLPEGKHSVKGCGSIMTDPIGVDILGDGLIIPGGSCVSSKKKSVLQFNEFIVYSPAQVKMKYLLRVEFHF